MGVNSERCECVAYPVSQIWKEYDGETEQTEAAPTESETGPLKSEYLDIIISDVRTKNGFAFSVQILNTEGNIISSSLKYL